MEDSSVSVTTLEDGTTVYKTAGGDIYAQDNLGNAMSAGSAIGAQVLNSFASLFTYGVKSVIDNRNRDAQIAQQIKLTQAGIVPANLGAGLGSLMPLLVLGGIGFLAYKLIKG